MFHEQLAEWFNILHPRLEFEKPVEVDVDDGITLVGHADCHDPAEEVVYEFKTRSNWYRLHRPVDRHRNQVETYLRGLDSEHGQIIYLSKSDMEIRFDPQLYPDDVRASVVNMDPLSVALIDSDSREILVDQHEPEQPAFFGQDDERFFDIVEKARDIQEAVLEEGVASCPKEVPFEHCSCFFCDIERLWFADTPTLESDPARLATACR